MALSSILMSEQLTSGFPCLKTTPKRQSRMTLLTIQIFPSAFLSVPRCSAQRVSLRAVITGRSKWAVTTSVDWALRTEELTARVLLAAWGVMQNPGVWSGLMWSFPHGTTASRLCWQIPTQAVWASCWTAIREAQLSIMCRTGPSPSTPSSSPSLSPFIQLSGCSQMVLLCLCASSATENVWGELLHINWCFVHLWDTNNIYFLIISSFCPSIQSPLKLQVYKNIQWGLFSHHNPQSKHVWTNACSCASSKHDWAAVDRIRYYVCVG